MKEEQRPDKITPTNPKQDLSTLDEPTEHRNYNSGHPGFSPLDQLTIAAGVGLIFCILWVVVLIVAALFGWL